MPPRWTEDDPDASLVQAAVAGRRDAFDELVRRHQRRLYQLCFRMAGSHEDAADLLQETFLRAWRGMRGFKGQSSVATWLYRIAVNACLNRVTSRRLPALSLDEVAEPVDRGRRADQAIDEAEQASRVRRAVAHLPPRQRAALILRIYHDLPHREIARLLGSSVGAVKANVFHALRNVKRWLEAAEG